MDMDDYDGPTVAVLVRTQATILGVAHTEIVSVHRDRPGAASALAERVLEGGGLGPGWSILTVPAPFLVRRDAGQAEDDRGTGGQALGPQLWAALAPTGIPEGADEAAMVARVRDLVQNVRDGLTEPRRLDGLYRELRDALRPAQTDPTAVDRMTRGALLDLVRSVVEAANTPAMAEIPESAVIELAEAVGWSASDVRGVPGSFARLLREIRNRV